MTQRTALTTDIMIC